MLALPTFWLIVLTYWPPGISRLAPNLPLPNPFPPPCYRQSPLPSCPLTFAHRCYFQTRIQFPTRASRNAPLTCFFNAIYTIARNVTHWLECRVGGKEDKDTPGRRGECLGWRLCCKTNNNWELIWTCFFSVSSSFPFVNWQCNEQTADFCYKVWGTILHSVT